MKPAPRKIQTGQLPLHQLQSNMVQLLNKLRLAEILDGVLVKNKTIGTGGTVVEHELVREPLGYIIVDQDKGATIHRTAWTTRTITLVSSVADTTVSIWIF